MVKYFRESTVSANLQILETNILGLSNDFAKVSVDPKINFIAEAGFAMQALQNNDYLSKVACANAQSLYDAVTNISAIGISLNPASKQAYLVPRDSKVCLDISYMGMLQLAQQTSSILWGQALVVRKNDKFQRNGIDKAPDHQFNDFDTEEERGEIVGVYCVVKLPNGDYLTHTMRIDDVYKIRDRSAGYKSGKASPWKSDPEEMIKKTCIKQAYKTWPKNERIDKAIHYLDTDGGEGIEFNEVQNNNLSGNPNDPDYERIVGLLIAASENGTKALSEQWKLLAKEERRLIGKARLDTLKEYATSVDAKILDHDGDGKNGTSANG